MKRDEALAPLSRDHHASLILAQLLKRNAPVYNGLPTGVQQKATYAMEQFNLNIKKHFLLEEEMLDKVKNINTEIDTIAAEIIIEHQQLTALFQSLAQTNEQENIMDILATSLQQHIRKEERVLFPLLQQHCSAAIMQDIDALLH